MKTKRIVIFAAVVVLILVAAFFLWGPGTVPAGQQPLVTLSSANFTEFENAFNADSQVPRMLFLASPT